MNLRPKTIRRLTILLVAVLLLVGSVIGLMVLDRQKQQKELARRRAEGLAAFERNDYPATLEHLKRYIGHKDVKPDPDAIFAFAKARMNIELPKQAHVKESIMHLRNYVELRPDDLAAKHLLLELYPRARYLEEARDLADEVLAKDPNDLKALKAKAITENALDRPNEALAAAMKVNELAPEDLESQQITLHLMQRARHTPEQIAAHADQLLAKHPNDPKFELLKALALQPLNKPQEMVAMLRQAASRPPPDPQFVRGLVRLLEQAGLFSDAHKYLERLLETQQDPAVLEVLAMRLWQEGRYDELLNRLNNLEAATASADLLGLKALSLFQVGRSPEEAQAVLGDLDSRKSDPAAQTWAAGLRTRFVEKPSDPRDLVQKYTDALSKGADNGVIHYMLGEAYQAMGEAGQAVDAWEDAARAQPSWSLPYVQIARVLTATGRYTPALEAAREAFRRAPGQGLASIALAHAWFGKVGESPDLPEAKKLFDFLSQIQSSTAPAGEPETLPAYVTIAARLGKKDEAATAIARALDHPERYDANALLRLSNAARAAGLDEAAMKVGTAMQSLKVESPEVALARALSLHSAGKTQDGLALLNDLSTRTGTTEAQLALARYHDATGDSSALAAWATLADANPQNLQVQSLALESPSRTKDRAFWLRTIERARSLTSDQATLWRMEKARYVLSDPHQRKDAREMADTLVMLKELTQASPDLVEPRVLLATALETASQPNPVGAIEQLRVAYELKPSDAAIGMRLYHLLRQQGRLDEAASHLERLSRNPRLDGQSRLQIAALAADQGQTDRAIELLRAAKDDDNAQQRDVLLARILARRGQFDEASAVYSKYESTEAPTQALVQAAADFFATRGQSETATKFLAMLDRMQLRPGMRELILAGYEDAHGSGQRATELYAQAAAAAPSDPFVWQQKAIFELRQGNHADAIASAEQGLKHAPDDLNLQKIKANAQVLASGAGKVDLEPLIAAMSRDAQNAWSVEAIRALEAAREQKLGDEETLARLRPVADRYPQALPLQVLLARSYLTLGQTAEAAALADRALGAFPSDPQAAKLATQVYEVMGEPNRWLAAAQKWRSLSHENPVDADASIAAAMLAKGDAAAALKTLAPYVSQIEQDPAKHVGLTTAYAAARVKLGKPEVAQDLVRPLIGSSPQWRRAWFDLALAHSSGGGAAEWLNQIESQVPTDEHATLARAWFGVWSRHRYDKALPKAKALLQPLADSGKARVADLRQLAYINQALGDMAGAEQAFRMIVEREPTQSDALNNTAYLMLMRNGDLQEARQLSERAVTNSPKVASYHDTLARIHDKLGNSAAAHKSFDAALALDAMYLDALVGKADLLLRDGNAETARDLLPQIDKAVKQGGPVASDLQVQLDHVRAAIE